MPEASTPQHGSHEPLHHMAPSSTAGTTQVSRVDYYTSRQAISSDTPLLPRHPPIYHYTNSLNNLHHNLVTITAYTTNHAPARAHTTPNPHASTIQAAPSFRGNEHPLSSLPLSNLPTNSFGTAPPPVPSSPTLPFVPSSPTRPLRLPHRKPIRATPTATIPTTAPTTAKASPNAGKSPTTRGKASDGRCG